MRLAASSISAGGMALLLAACGGESAELRGAEAAAATPVAEKTVAAEPAPDPRPVGTLCPDPAGECAGFRSNDLTFVLPTDGVARAEVRSDSFYAVILRSAARCAIPDAERQEVQTRFPGRKVFAQRFECEDDIANNVAYAGASDTVAFMAVYADTSRPAADSVLASVRASGDHPGANLRRMQVVFVYP